MSVRIEEPAVATSRIEETVAAQEEKLQGWTAPEETESAPLYYDIPMLKRPVWKWEISLYFFLEGISAGSYILARLAEHVGGERYRRLGRTATAVSAATYAACPPLLIKDLGDPARFYNMLRVVKPLSPMNVGSWNLSAFGGVNAASVLREFLGDKAPKGVRPLLDASDWIGVPLAMGFLGYTGILLSATSTPLWSRSPWLGPLFTTSAVYNSAEAIDLVMTLKDPEHLSPDNTAGESLERIKFAAKAAEAVNLAGYLLSGGGSAAPVTKGKYAPHLWMGAVGAGLIAPQVLNRLSSRQGDVRRRKWLKAAAGVLGLLGGLSLKWAMVHGGQASADDLYAARDATKAK